GSRRARSRARTRSAHLRDSAEGHRETCGEDDERADRWEEADQPALEAQTPERLARKSRNESDPGDAERQAGAEREDQDEAERDPVQRDRGQQDDEGRRAGKEPAGYSDREQRAEARDLAVAGAVVIMTVPEGVAPTQARAQNSRPDPDDEQARYEVQPRVELVRDDQLRERERDEPQCEDPDRVRHGHDQAEQRRVCGRAALPHQVGGDDRLAVSGGERMRGAPEDRSRERGEDDERAQAGTADERAEAGVSDPVRRLEAVAARKLGRDRSARVGRERGRDRAHVERALEQVLRVGTELVARAGGRRAD